MNEYEKYVKEINNIFTILEKTKKILNDPDNLEYVENITSYREDVLKCASYIEKSSSNKEVNNK